MHWGKLLAYTMTVLVLGAAAGYLYDKNYRQALYWFLVDCINTTVTYGS